MVKGKPLVSDELWTVVAPLLPPELPKPRGCRRSVSDLAILTGIFFVLKFGIPWKPLPQEKGFGNGADCWHRLRDWQAAGVWDGLQREWLDRLGEAGHIDWSRASLKSLSNLAGGRVRRPQLDGSRQSWHGAPRCGDPGGIPLASLLTDAHLHDSTVFEVLVDAIPPVKMSSGRRRKRPAKLHADKCYDYRHRQSAFSRRHIKVRIARKCIESIVHQGQHRWVVDRTLAWLNHVRRPRVHDERRAAIHHAIQLSAGR